MVCLVHLIIYYQTMVSERSFLYGLLCLQWIVTPSIFWIIWSYLTSKPLGSYFTYKYLKDSFSSKSNNIFQFNLGMQTLFDQMIKNLILCSSIACLSSTLTNLEYQHMSSNIAIFFIYLQRFGAIIFFTQILSTFIVKYMCIYHPSIVENQDENTVIKSSR